MIARMLTIELTVYSMMIYDALQLCMEPVKNLQPIEAEFSCLAGFIATVDCIDDMRKLIAKRLLFRSHRFKT